jgi:hypothetical protein
MLLPRQRRSSDILKSGEHGTVMIDPISTGLNNTPSAFCDWAVTQSQEPNIRVEVRHTRFVYTVNLVSVGVEIIRRLFELAFQSLPTGKIGIWSEIKGRP